MYKNLIAVCGASLAFAAFSSAQTPITFNQCNVAPVQFCPVGTGSGPGSVSPGYYAWLNNPFLGLPSQITPTNGYLLVTPSTANNNDLRATGGMMMITFQLANRRFGGFFKSDATHPTSTGFMSFYKRTATGYAQIGTWVNFPMNNAGYHWAGYDLGAGNAADMVLLCGQQNYGFKNLLCNNLMGSPN